MSVYSKKPVILCVDDEKTILETLEQQIITRLGKNFDLELADSGEEALEIVTEVTEDGRELAVLVSDQIMPGMKGDELLIEVHRTHPETLKILLTGQASLDAIINAINQARLYRYVAKPWEVNDLMMTIEQAARSYQQRTQILEYNQHNRLLRSLNKASQEISGEIEIQKVIERFLYSVGQNLSPRVAYVLLPDNNNRWMVADLYVADSMTAQRIREQQNNDPEGFSGYVWQKCLVETPQCISLPILHRNRPIAYVLIEKDALAEPFNSNHREMLMMLGAQAAISLQNAKLYEDLANSARELQQEKEKVERMHEDLTDSIQYAQRIQRSLLPPPEHLTRAYPDSFIFYHPKDFVSGDFYWLGYEEEYLYVAVADCTGHGVPGALMAAMGGAKIAEILKQNRLPKPEKILSDLHYAISDSLHQGYTRVNDGMDIALCRINTKEKIIDYAGANRPIIVFHGKEQVEYLPDRLPIGRMGAFDSEERIFTPQRIEYTPGDRLYLFTDGITDQFGGMQARKLTKKRFFDYLISIYDSPIAKQGELIRQFLDAWRNNLSQTDDMLMIGIELH